MEMMSSILHLRDMAGAARHQRETTARLSSDQLKQALPALQWLPVRKCCCLADTLPVRVDQVPDDRLFDLESLPGTADADAAIVVYKAVSGCTSHKLSAFIAVHGFGCQA